MARLSLDRQAQQEKSLIKSDSRPSVLEIYPVLSWVPNSGTTFCDLTQECPESILLHLLRMIGWGWGAHTHDWCLL